MCDTFFSVLSVPEISHYLSEAHMLLKDYYIWLKTLRGDQPGVVSKIMVCWDIICYYESLFLRA
jgi:hypothetical protein